ncbi:threonine dehydrogenase-like Zn-dependent dehydrogenase [Streptomyces sp. HB372]|nr:threonine dehydrogenase-like Zn-dependent dehydrogenase [Streptomyces sp. HB372]
MSAPRAWTVRAGVPRLTAAPAIITATDAKGDTATVRVRFAGVCGSDVAKLCPTWRDPVPNPWFPGHEIVGVDAHTNRWVAVDPLVSCRICDACAQGRVHLCQQLRRIGWDLPGGLAETVRVPTSALVPLPTLRDRAHGVLADPMAVALHGVRCGLRVRPGRLGIVGAGPLGVCVAVCAGHAGWDVHLSVRSAERADALRQHLSGLPVTVHHLVLPACDAVVDAASGHDDSPLRQAVASVRDGGIVLVLNAYAPRVTLTLPLRELFRRSVTVRGSFSYCRSGGPDDFRDALALLLRAGPWADLLTSARFPVTDLPRALAALRGPIEHRPHKVLLSITR